MRRETSWLTNCNRARINSQTLQIAKDAEIHKWLLDTWHREKEQATHLLLKPTADLKSGRSVRGKLYVRNAPQEATVMQRACP